MFSITGTDGGPDGRMVVRRTVSTVNADGTTAVPAPNAPEPQAGDELVAVNQTLVHHSNFVKTRRQAGKDVFGNAEEFLVGLVGSAADQPSGTKRLLHLLFRRSGGTFA
ncbi:unnamed protein product, partial [Amoebophrya sp. A25]|eukprot:GSA25T00018604001.1